MSQAAGNGIFTIVIVLLALASLYSFGRDLGFIKPLVLKTKDEPNEGQGTNEEDY